MNEFMYLIRRELWEHRALYIVPLVFAGIVLLSVTVGVARGTQYVGTEHIAQNLQHLTPQVAGEAMAMLSYGMWTLFSVVSVFVVAFYLLDALYGDRKDRSVLFWKSLPISDTQTVLSKLATATLVTPIIVLVVALATTLLVLIILSVAVGISGANPFSLLWSKLPVLSIIGNMLTVEVAHSLWFLPLTGWLMLASASAKKTPFLLASLVPLGLIFAEKLAFNTQTFAHTIRDYVARFYEPLFEDVEELSVGHDGINVDGSMIDFAQISGILTDPVMYVGVAIGAGFIVLTIWMRKRRIDIG